MKLIPVDGAKIEPKKLESLREIFSNAAYNAALDSDKGLRIGADKSAYLAHHLGDGLEGEVLELGLKKENDEVTADARVRPMDSYKNMVGAIADHDAKMQSDPAYRAKWEGIISELHGNSPLNTLEQINARFNYSNRLPYRTDQENYGVDDKTVNPITYLERGGDCDDAAVAKYLALRDTGFDMERIKFVNGIFDYTKGGKAPEKGMEFHVSVMYQAGDKELLLDNRLTEDASGKTVNNPTLFDLKDPSYLRSDYHAVNYTGMYDPLTNIIIERRSSGGDEMKNMPLNMDDKAFRVSKPAV